MNQTLFDRSTGSLSPKAFAHVQISRLSHSIQLAPRLLFDGAERSFAPEISTAVNSEAKTSSVKIWAHQAGVSALAVDIDGRHLLSGGSDSIIKLWDLEDCSTYTEHVFKPISSTSRDASSSQSFGITQLSFYPFDSAAFLSSSYSHHLKLYGTETLSVSADFDLHSIIYTHALSSIASHLLVACATQNPTVRLVDLKSGSSTHSLAGHHGALLSLAWSPTHEHILASGGTDGTVRVWDIRKSSAALGVLDMEDSTGIVGTDGMGRVARSRERGKSHIGAVNAITWTDDGSRIISSGHDDRIRVWDAATAANTLVSFGPLVKNRHLSTLPLVTTPNGATRSTSPILFYPNEREILAFELHDGRLLKRLRVPGPNVSALRSRTGERNVKSRITGLTRRGDADGIYSSHTDGQIRAWLPRSADDELLDKEEEAVDGESKRQLDDADEDVRRKRQALDDVFRDLTKQKITFG